jgi:predicted nucleic acid-binding Zn ribbon protein
MIHFDDMQGIGTLPALVLPALLARAPLTAEKVTFVWGLAVGSAIARATTAALADTVLTVRTTDPAWAREVERSRALILSRVQQLLGPALVRSIVIQKPDSGRKPRAQG